MVKPVFGLESTVTGFQFRVWSCDSASPGDSASTLEFAAWCHGIYKVCEVPCFTPGS